MQVFQCSNPRNLPMHGLCTAYSSGGAESRDGILSP